MVAMDWDSLAGLLDIPYEKREEIRTNYVKYPDSTSKAEEVLKDFNCSDDFGRDVFGKCVDELGRHDLIKKLHPMENEVFSALKFRDLSMHKSPVSFIQYMRRQISTYLRLLSSMFIHTSSITPPVNNLSPSLGSLVPTLYALKCQNLYDETNFESKR